MKSIKVWNRNHGSRRMKQIGAGALAVAVLAGSVTWAGFGAWANEDPDAVTETQETIEKEYPNLLSSPESDGRLSKEETTYVVMDADGNVKDVSVSEWLRNGTGADSISDVSTLSDIENTSNDKEFTQDGSKLTWKADGADIKYKGNTDKELPVKVSVSYYLDGEKMSASDMAGKSGHVEIRFNYTINDKVQADGYTFTTPYTMASGVLLDDEHFTDVKVEGGKVIDDGSKCVCLGIAFPNLQSNLNTDLSSIDIPESVKIEAYTDKFEIDGSYTVALTGMFSDMDFSGTGSIEDKVGELESALGQLGSASEKLVKGASQLSSGADTLDENASTLKSGAHKLSKGTGDFSKGATTLAEGASVLAEGTKKALSGVGDLKDGTKQLKDGSASLADGTGQLKDGSAALSDGTGQLKDGSEALSDGTGQLKDGSAALADGTGQLKDGSAALSDGTGQLKEGSASLAAGTADLKGGIDQLATGAGELGSGFTQIMSGAGSLDDGLAKLSSSGDAGSGIKGAASAYQSGMEQYAAAMDAMIESETDPATKANLKGLRDKLPMPDDYTAAVNNYVAGVDSAYTGEQQVYGGLQQIQSKLPTLIDGISELQTGADNLNTGAQSVAAGAASADAGAKELATGAASADAGAKELATGAASADAGAKALASGAKDADDGAKTLAKGASDVNDGAVQVKDGAAALDEGAGKLKSGASELNKGAGQLKDGANSLSSGAGTLNKGANTLADGTDEFKKGTSKLSNGASELYDGMSQFNKEGIQKLISTMDDAGIEDLMNRLKALADASSQGTFVGGKSDKMDGESRIIFKTEAVKAD